MHQLQFSWLIWIFRKCDVLMRNDDSSFSLTAYTIKNELLFKTKFYLYIKLN